MNEFLQTAKKIAKSKSNQSCDVEGCTQTDTEVITLKPLDPIDHDETIMSVCPKHELWARERNEFAEEMTEKMREYRKELGQKHLEKTQRLAHPQDGRVRKDILMGEPEEDRIPLGQTTVEGKQQLDPAFEDDVPELEGEDDE